MGESEAMSESCPLPSGRDFIADAGDWKSFVEKLRQQWRLLWRERIDDKVRAEGIADRDFELLFVDRGTVIVATRCFKQLDFMEILEEYKAPYDMKVKQEVPMPQVGGWRKFGREMAALRRGARKNGKSEWPVDKAKSGRETGQQQLKKGGRGWLHIKIS